MLETQVYERFASLGCGLDVIVRMVAAADGKIWSGSLMLGVGAGSGRDAGAREGCGKGCR